jgi:uncharacterized cupin superfamily protein
MARLTVTQGYVRIDRPDSPSGDPAQLNMPLTEGHSIVTGDDGQAEIEFEDGSVARLTPNSTISLTRLTASSGSTDTQLAMSRGLAYFELRSAPGIAFGIAAGDEHLVPLENTTLRIDLDQPPASVAVLDGAVRLERRGGTAFDLRAGESFRTQQIAPDTWDQWNETLDQQAADAAARQTSARATYAGSQGYGWADLDAHGTWYDTAANGPVWQPEGGDSADFDPYGNGSWVWYPSGGYLWASAYPWGWTPFRCGSWSFFDSFGWAWAPGTGCGSFGFAGGGGFGYGGGRGGYLNILQVPLHHPLPHPPAPQRGGIHPIVSVHTGTLMTAPHDRPRDEPRFLAGRLASPLPPASLGYTVRGAPLRRDFPVDRTTRIPILGLQAGQTASHDRNEKVPVSVGGVLTTTPHSTLARMPAPGTQPNHPRPLPSGNDLHRPPTPQGPAQYSVPRLPPPPPSRPAFTPPSQPAHTFTPAPARSASPPAPSKK